MSDINLSKKYFFGVSKYWKRHQLVGHVNPELEKLTLLYYLFIRTAIRV